LRLFSETREPEIVSPQKLSRKRTFLRRHETLQRVGGRGLLHVDAEKASAPITTDPKIAAVSTCARSPRDFIGIARR